MITRADSLYTKDGRDKLLALMEIPESCNNCKAVFKYNITRLNNMRIFAKTDK